jgi:hypothetical protein
MVLESGKETTVGEAALVDKKWLVQPVSTMMGGEGPSLELVIMELSNIVLILLDWLGVPLVPCTDAY